jgi:hypothetical protein
MRSKIETGIDALALTNRPDHRIRVGSLRQRRADFYGRSPAIEVVPLSESTEMLDKIPYPSDMNDEGTFAAHTHQERFGSWDQALDAAGIDKEQELLKDMQRVADEVGEDMKQEDMNEYGLYSSSMAAVLR